MQNKKNIISTAVASGSLFPLCLSAYWSVRLAAADHFSRTSSIPDVQRSIRLAPGNALYLLRLAELRAGEGNDASPDLRQAAEASPLNSAVWIQIGLQAEQKGDMVAAAQALHRAARLDRQFRPRWDLASFYVRRNDFQQSRQWAREALLIGPPEDFPAVFRLCWSVGAPAEVIWRDAIPKTPVVMERYLGFLLAKNELAAASPVAARLVEVAEASQVRSLLLYCDAAIAGGRASEALSCWNGMSRRGLLPYPAVDPSAGRSLVNGNFQRAPMGHGFDWRPTPMEGVSVDYDELSPHLRIAFSGKQPESCEPLTTWIALQPLRKYRLRCRYESVGIPPGPGLKWQIHRPANGAGILPDVPVLSHEGQTMVDMEFQAPEAVEDGAVQLSRLALVYQRAPGTVRIEGSLRLLDVSLDLVP